LQFTELTTVSGTASQSLSAGVSIPFGVHRPSTSPISDTFTSMFGLSGGPTFSVANLSTKEFYSGILTPLEPLIITYYLSRAHTAQWFLPLVVSDIIYGPKNILIHNDASNFHAFWSALNALIAIGLTAETSKNVTAESPILSERDARDSKLLASLASGAATGNTTLDLKRYEVPLTFAEAKDPNLTLVEYGELKRTNEMIYFRLEKYSTKYRFCIDPLSVGESPGTLPRTIHLAHEEHGSGIPGTEVTITKQSLCGSQGKDNKDASAEPDVSLKGLENLKFKPRSTMEIITFLGESIRYNNPPLVSSPIPRSPPTVTLFAASEVPPKGPSIRATVDTHTYYVEVDATDNNMSTRVMELLAELIALHSSAKDLPAPNVITVISP
jgi:hypothetical protein